MTYIVSSGALTLLQLSQADVANPRLTTAPQPLTSNTRPFNGPFPGLPGNISACWRHGVVVSSVRRMNEVNARRAQLVPGWVTVFGRVYHLGT